MLKKRKKQRRWWQTQLYSDREVYSASSLLADLNFQSVSGLYKNFTSMSPAEFGCLINLIGKRIAKIDTTFRKAISVQERLALTLRFLASGDSYVSLYHSFLSPLHSEHTATKAAQKELTHRTVVYCVRDTERVHTSSSRNCNIPLMRRANTDTAPNRPVTLHRNQLLIRYGSRVASALSRYGVTLRGNVTSVYAALQVNHH
jgi:hypothetical protein